MAEGAVAKQVWKEVQATEAKLLNTDGRVMMMRELSSRLRADLDTRPDPTLRYVALITKSRGSSG